jgi:hypothetical protein
MASNGKVIHESGKYFLEIDNKRHELTPELSGGEDALKAIVGQEVEVLYAKPTPVALAVKGKVRITCYLVMSPEQLGHVHPIEATVKAQLGADVIRLRPTCYVPAPWVIKGVEEQVRENLARELHAQGIISQEVYDKLAGK